MKESADKDKLPHNGEQSMTNIWSCLGNPDMHAGFLLNLYWDSNLSSTVDISAFYANTMFYIKTFNHIRNEILVGGFILLLVNSNEWKCTWFYISQNHHIKT